MESFSQRELEAIEAYERCRSKDDKAVRYQPEFKPYPYPKVQIEPKLRAIA